MLASCRLIWINTSDTAYEGCHGNIRRGTPFVALLRFIFSKSLCSIRPKFNVQEIGDTFLFLFTTCLSEFAIKLVKDVIDQDNRLYQVLASLSKVSERLETCYH